MKFLHLADTHLGFSAYRKITDDGLNQRELDIYNAFIQCIDYAIRTKPAFVLHAGDLFDSVRPTNRAITVAIQQVLRLSQNKIPFLVISGNHDSPKLKETGNILKIFDHLENIYPIYEACSTPIILEKGSKKIAIYAIPQCQTKREYNDIFEEIEVDNNSDFNILMTHGAVSEIKEFKMNEFNELIIPSKAFDGDFNYVALGHYHKYTKIRENMYYCGSTENFSFPEAKVNKGFLEIELGNKIMHSFIEINNRPMIDITPIDCSNLSVDEVEKKIKQNIKVIQPEGKIFRIRLLNIPSHTYRGIDFNQIRALSRGCVHFEIKPEVLRDENIQLNENYKIESIQGEFEKYLTTQTIENKNELLKLGIEYIRKVELKDEGK